MTDTKEHEVHVEPREMARVENAQMMRDDAPASMLDVIARAAKDPSINVDKLERLLAIQERLQADQRKTAFFAALSELEAELPQITKAGTILDRGGAVRNKFAKIEDIDVAIRPLCKKHGFAFSFDSTPPTPAGATYTCTMSHREGHSETKQITLPIDTGGGRSNVQSVGSTTSYARRYLLTMHLHLITRDEDDDGISGGKRVTQEQAMQLKAALAQVNGSEARFLNWAAAASFEDIPAANFDRCISFIEAKRGGA